MKYRITCYLLFLVINFFQAQIRFNSGKLNKKHYSDTIRYENKFDFIIVPVKLNGAEKKLIFDTGADLLLLEKDSLFKMGSVTAKITDSQGATSRTGFDMVKELRLSGLSYTDFVAAKMDLPQTFLCLSDGLMGNNIIKKSNWQICSDYIIVTDTRLKKGPSFVDFYYFDSNRFFSNMKINEARFDTCLIDYGGRFEIELPMKYYLQFTSGLKKINAVTRKISVRSGVNGQTNPDTTLTVNCDIGFNGIPIDSVNVVFSKKLTERRIGILLLNRFRSVFIDTDSRRLFFELPVSRSKEPFYDTPVFVDLENGYFEVKGKIIRESMSGISVGDQFKSMNGRLPENFKDYCDFLEWRQSLKMAPSLTCITKDNKELKLEKQK